MYKILRSDQCQVEIIPLKLNNINVTVQHYLQKYNFNMNPTSSAAASKNLENIIRRKINWTKCCLCQSNSGKTNCPARNPILEDRNSGYKSLAKNLNELVPYKFKISDRVIIDDLDEGSGIENTLISMKACWHKKCTFPFQGSKFQRLLKNLAVTRVENCIIEDKLIDAVGSQATRSSMNLLKKDLCFMCAQPGSKTNVLHQCTTHDFSKLIKMKAEMLDDAQLLGLVNFGDLVAQEAKYHSKCLTRLYNRCRQYLAENSDAGIQMCESIAFAHVVQFIEGYFSIPIIIY